MMAFFSGRFGSSLLCICPLLAFEEQQTWTSIPYLFLLLFHRIYAAVKPYSASSWMYLLLLRMSCVS
ncbi:hypothetical protein LINPERHAP1_LOCUS37791 [Linum perenne]